MLLIDCMKQYLDYHMLANLSYYCRLPIMLPTFSVPSLISLIMFVLAPFAVFVLLPCPLLLISRRVQVRHATSNHSNQITHICVLARFLLRDAFPDANHSGKLVVQYITNTPPNCEAAGGFSLELLFLSYIYS